MTHLKATLPVPSPGAFLQGWVATRRGVTEEALGLDEAGGSPAALMATKALCFSTWLPCSFSWLRFCTHFSSPAWVQAGQMPHHLPVLSACLCPLGFTNAEGPLWSFKPTSYKKPTQASLVSPTPDSQPFDCMTFTVLLPSPIFKFF